MGAFVSYRHSSRFLTVSFLSIEYKGFEFYPVVVGSGSWIAWSVEHSPCKRGIRVQALV